MEGTHGIVEDAFYGDEDFEGGHFERQLGGLAQLKWNICAMPTAMTV